MKTRTSVSQAAHSQSRQHCEQHRGRRGGLARRGKGQKDRRVMVLVSGNNVSPWWRSERRSVDGLAHTAG